MKIFKDFSLKNHNTFGLGVSCSYFAEVSKEADISQLIQEKQFISQLKLVIGGGSNILFTKDFYGLVIHQTSNNIKIISENDEFATIKSDAGVVWHELVLFALDKNLGGIENLSLIPGSVGAAPIQNIGAYGQELKDVFVSLSGIFIEDGTIAPFNLNECKFGYRESVFKNNLKNKFIITEVVLKLNKNPKPNIGYGSIQEEISKRKINNPTIKDVSNVICDIRSSKLPDPKKLGNAGSFFKNPEVPNEKYHELKSKFSEMPGYSVSANTFKIPAAWLIEKCGFKGKRFGNIGVHEKQALVIVNYGNGRPEEIIQLKDSIKKTVTEKFGITLVEEVSLY